jgi:hypothetical protein
MTTTKVQNLTPPPGELSLARQSLRLSLEAKERARVLAKEAEDVVQAATAAVDEARAEAAKFADLDSEVVKSRLAFLKREPGVKSQEEIRASLNARIIANEELKAAEETLQVAQSELADANGNIARSEKVCASHAISVLSEVASIVSAKLTTVNVERERLRMILQGLMLVTGSENLPESTRANLIMSSASHAGMPVGDFRDWQHLLWKIGEALEVSSWRKSLPPLDQATGIASARAYWKQVADAVIADPAADPAPLPSVKDLWG